MSANWTCTSCGASNFADVCQCAKCGALNYGGVDDEEPATKKAKVEAPNGSFVSDPFPYTMVGKTVEIQGLVAKPDLNGAKGTVKDYDYATMRYTIECIRGTFKLKRENLKELQPAAPQPTAVATDPLIGKTMVVQGLKAKPELNGTRGVVKEFDASAGRYTIDIDGGGGQFKLKPDNLIEPPQDAAPPQGLPGATTYSIPNTGGHIGKNIPITALDKGAIIGSGGKQIAKMREESGARVKVDPDPLGRDEFAVLNIQGTLNQVEVAEKMALEAMQAKKVEEMAKESAKKEWESKSWESSKDDSWDSGKKSKDWDDSSKKWESSKESKGWDSSNDWGSSNKWSEPEKIKKIIEVEQTYIAGVVGKGGCFIKEMAQQAGCKIAFQQASEHDAMAPPGKQVCFIQGTAEQVVEAEKLVMAKVAEVSSNPKWKTLPDKKPAQSWDASSWGSSPAESSWGASGAGGEWKDTSSAGNSWDSGNKSSGASWSDSSSTANAWTSSDKTSGSSWNDSSSNGNSHSNPGGSGWDGNNTWNDKSKW